MRSGACTNFPRGAMRVHKELLMLHYAVVFLVIALVAAVFGFGGIAWAPSGIAKGPVLRLRDRWPVVSFIIGLLKKN